MQRSILARARLLSLTAPYDYLQRNAADRRDLFALARRQPQFAFSSAETRHALENPDFRFGAKRAVVWANAEPGFEHEPRREAPVHVRGHDETEAGRRAGAVAGWEMGGVRRGRRRPRSEHENLASMDRAGDRR